MSIHTKQIETLDQVRAFPWGSGPVIKSPISAFPFTVHAFLRNHLRPLINLHRPCLISVLEKLIVGVQG